MMDLRDTDLVPITVPVNSGVAATPAARRKPARPLPDFDETWIPPDADVAADGDERLPMGAALSIILLLSLGLWGLIITVVLWLIRVT